MCFLRTADLAVKDLTQWRLLYESGDLRTPKDLDWRKGRGEGACALLQMPAVLEEVTWVASLCLAVNCGTLAGRSRGQ